MVSRSSPYCPNTLLPDEAEPDLAPEGTAGTRTSGERARIRFGQRRLDGAAYSSIRPGHCLMDSAGRVVSECRPLALGHRPRTVPIGFVSP